MANSRHIERVSKFAAIAAMLLLPVLFVAGQPEPANTPVAVEAIYLAKDDGNGQAGEQVSTFQTTDARIYCIVQLNSDSGATVKMNFVAVSVPGVKADTNVVSTSYTTKNGESRVDFYGKPKTKWTAGKYRVEIFVDGKVVKELPFDITGPMTAVGSSFVQPAAKPKPKPPNKPKKNQDQ